MPVLPILALVCAAVCGLALSKAYALRRATPGDRINAYLDSSLNRVPDLADLGVRLDIEPRQSPASKLVTWLGGRLGGRLGTVSEAAIREQLMRAGMYTVSPRTVMGYRVLATIVLPTLAFLALGVHKPLNALIVVLALFAGWIGPLTVVQRKARLRVTEIDRALPDLIDLLCVMVEAGMSFPAALRLSSEQFQPPLSDELRLTLQEQTMGLGIDEALGHMAQRADTPGMRAFVRAMAQGQKTGISTGQIMRSLSHEMRHRRRSTAEERAQKTPILMLFPLVFLIFPAMFIVLLAPAAMSMLHSFKGV